MFSPVYSASGQSGTAILEAESLAKQFFTGN